jgi:hypothetical protein
MKQSRSGCQILSETPTCELRWAFSPRNDVDPVLEQKWIIQEDFCSSDGRDTYEEWRSIPEVLTHPY